MPPDVAPAGGGERRHVLVFDIGGTSLRAGLYDSGEDCLVRSARRATPGFRQHPGVPIAGLVDILLRAMAAMAGELCQRRPPADVAIAFPGPVDPGGAVLAAPTIWGDMVLDPPLPFGALAGELWPGASVRVLNDMSAAGLYYRRRPDEDFCVFTVSSGIGHKMFIGGRPLIGPGGRGGEIGHLRIDASTDAPACECGGTGHVAAFGSGAAVPFALRAVAAADPAAWRRSSLWRDDSEPGGIGNEALAAAFRADDAYAQAVAARLALASGTALAALHLATGVERFVILGGFARALGPGFVRLLADAAGQASWKLGGDWHHMLEISEAHDDAGLIGAGRHAIAAPVAT